MMMGGGDEVAMDDEMDEEEEIEDDPVDTGEDEGETF